MAKATPKPGEIWTFTDSQRAERELLVLAVTADGYVSYVLTHPTIKGACNVEIVGKDGECYVDPRKIVFTHTANLDERIREIPAAKMDKVRSVLRRHLLLPAPEETDTLRLRLDSAQRSVLIMSEKIKDLTAQRDDYKGLVDRLMDKLTGQVASSEQTAPQPEETPQPEAPKTLTKVERNRLRVAENREKYARQQAYIGVKLKSIGMKQVTLDRLIGRSDGCVAHWVGGDSKAHWAVLERIFPGIEKEAEEWAKNQEEKK